jgi:hypothetical protein
VGKNTGRSQSVPQGKSDTFVFRQEALALLVKGNLAAEVVKVYLRQKRIGGEKLLGKVGPRGRRRGGRREGRREGEREGRCSG